MKKDVLHAYKWLVSDDDPRLEEDSTKVRRTSFEVIKEIDSLSTQSIGTHAFFPETCRSLLEELQVELLATFGKFFPLQGEENTFVSSSRWGALAALYVLSQRISANGSVLLFRGQGDFRWTLTPSIERCSGRERQREMRRTQNFIEELTYTRGQAGLPTPHNLALSIAQHFGYKTSLMDWTYDPLVALWFATQRARIPNESKENGWPCIWMLPINHLVNDGLEIALPEPSIRRIYDQRGVLLDCQTSNQAWQKHAFRIIFDDENKLTPRFNPFWQGVSKRMYRPTEWIAAIEGRMSGQVSRELPIRPVKETVWLRRAYEVMNSLCLICDKDGSRVQVEIDILKCLTRQNSYIMDRLSSRLLSREQSPNAPDLQLAELIRECLNGDV